MIPLFTQSALSSRLLPLHITSTGRYNTFVNCAAFTGEADFTSAGWAANNQAVYVPMCIPARFTVARFFVSNGAAVSGNLDVGLYDAQLKRLISTGTTAQAGVSQVQYIGVTDQSFPAGNYYLALVLSTTSGRTTVSSLGLAQLTQITGITLENLGSTVLPATMTPAVRALASYPCFGFTQSDSL